MSQPVKLTPAIAAGRMGIHNPHNLVAEYLKANPGALPPIYIAYRPADNGRAALTAAWQVKDVTNHHTTDETQPHWRDLGWKTFRVGRYTGEDKAEQLTAAQDWTASKYGITDPWVKAPYVYGTSYLPAPVVTWFRATLKQWIKENS